MGGTWPRLLALCAGAIAALAGAPAASAQLEAGAASGDITPPVGTPMFAYTARSGIANPSHLSDILGQLVADPDPARGLSARTFVASRGIQTRVRANALVLRSPAGKFALVQADLGGLPYALTRVVARRIAPLGITPDRLVLSATHSHSSTGPIWPADNLGYGLLGGDLFDPRVFELTADGIVDAIVAANARLQPARLGTATTSVTDASRSRNFEPFLRDRDVPHDPARARAASIDPELTVIRVDRRDGSPLAVWTNFAIHPTSLGDDNLLFSGDNVAFAYRIAEREIAAAASRAGHPARGPVIDVWTNANEGDIAPNGSPGPLQQAPSDLASANLAGLRVARGTLRAWRAAGRQESSAPALGARRAFVAFDGTRADGEPVGPLPALGAGGIEAPDGFCSPFDGLAGPGQGRKFPLFTGLPIVPNVQPVSALRIGRLGLAAFPTEITRQMGLRIRTALQRYAGGAFDRIALVGLADGYASYTATPEEYDACHYEGSFTLFGRREGARLLDAGRSVLGALLAGRPAVGAREPAEAAIGSRGGRPPRVTANAGRIVSQPDRVVRRFGQVAFSWHGGDPLVDAPRGRVFVTLERRTRGGWRTVATDDSYLDTVERSADGVWTERFQLDWCAPRGVQRFVVTGLADRGSGVHPYRAVSREFQVLQSDAVRPDQVRVRGRQALVRALYPLVGRGSLLAYPRRVLTGSAILRVRARGHRSRLVRARPDARAQGFVATVPRRAAVSVALVHDRCGNRGR